MVGNALSLRWGVTPVTVPKFEFVQDMFFLGSQLSTQTGFTREGDLAVAVVGMPIGVRGNTNLLRVIRVPEPKQDIRRA
jgi:pyruvate kinase